MSGADETVISVENAGKMYMLYDRPQDRLKQSLFARFGKSYGRPFWALKDVSLAVKKGESVGIVGRNGSGKSTLLQLIAGTLTPTEGNVSVRGKVAALLELGSGFNPDYTGRENVFMNGAILGLSREEVEKRFDSIAAFAEIEGFLDQPVKTYSSGMMLRLAFAVQVHVDAEILIVDEALAVGDVFFQAKCSRALQRFQEGGGTLLFVSHDMYAIEHLCTRAIVLHHGAVRFAGGCGDAVNHYYQIERGAAPRPAEASAPSATASNGLVELRRDYVTTDGSAVIQSVALTDEQGRATLSYRVGEWMTATVTVAFNRDVDGYDFGVGLRNRLGVLMGGAHTTFPKKPYGPVRAGEQVTLTARVRMNLAPETYLLVIGVARNYTPQHWVDLYTLWDCCAVQIIGTQAFWGQAYLEHDLS